MIYPPESIPDINIVTARKEVLRLLTANITINRYTKSATTATGGKTRTLLSSRIVKGLLQTVQNLAVEQDIGSNVTSLQRFTLLLPWNYDANELDEILLGGEVYQILDTNRRDSNRITLKLSLIRLT